MASFAEVLGNVSIDSAGDLTVPAGMTVMAMAAGVGGGSIPVPLQQAPAGTLQQPPPLGAMHTSAVAEEYGDLRCYLWTQLVGRVQAGEPAAMEELYAMFSNGVRFYLARQLGRDDIDDRLHDAFLVVVDAIRAGDLRDPRRLMGFIRTVVKRMVASSIDRQVQERRGRVDDERTSNVSDRAETPEGAMLFQQQAAIVREVLSELSGRDRDVLTRFYVEEQSAQQICDEMNLTMTQFRLLKSRAKNRFGELGRKKIQRSGLSQILLRFSQG
jgi:RNA polymerase sigma-70 factor (ECF subfamily)